MTWGRDYIDKQDEFVIGELPSTVGGKSGWGREAFVNVSL